MIWWAPKPSESTSGLATLIVSGVGSQSCVFLLGLFAEKFSQNLVSSNSSVSTTRLAVVSNKLYRCEPV